MEDNIEIIEDGDYKVTIFYNFNVIFHSPPNGRSK